VGTGDYDGDGRSDILWRNGATGDNLIWKGANGATTQGVAAVGDQNWQSLDGLESGDLLVGGAGNNVLHGTLRNDTLTGGLGNDTLTGSGGADRFVFDTAPHAATNLDTLTDFAAGTDKLVLDDAIFTSLTAGVPDPGSLLSGPGVASALDANDFLIYNTSAGSLYYDADGSNAGSSPVQFATLTDHPAITASDFVVS
jgi:Ca2+-binding RTX toxin-like protein